MPRQTVADMYVRKRRPRMQEIYYDTRMMDCFPRADTQERSEQLLENQFCNALADSFLGQILSHCHRVDLHFRVIRACNGIWSVSTANTVDRRDPPPERSTRVNDPLDMSSSLRITDISKPLL